MFLLEKAVTLLSFEKYTLLGMAIERYFRMEFLIVCIPLGS